LNTRIYTTFCTRRFKKEWGFMSAGTEHIMGADLGKNAYYMSTDDGKGKRTLMKRKIGTKGRLLESIAGATEAR
jgi:hypothetical protein